jgi:hypothetical protein
MQIKRACRRYGRTGGAVHVLPIDFKKTLLVKQALPRLFYPTKIVILNPHDQ